MKNVEAHIQKFVEYLQMGKEAYANSDIKTSNKYVDKQIKEWDKIRKIGCSAKDAFSVLLYHEDINVRVSAACLLLKHKHEEAKSVLIEASRLECPAAFGAEQCLKRWEEDDWHLDD